MAVLTELAEAFTILAAYDNGDISVEHDEVFAGDSDHHSPDRLKASDRQRLEELGWEWDEWIDRWKLSI